ncbi:methyltransferase domain-containing protein [Bacillus subtilis]|uniref:glycosyltransferase n=1 Tax=Bacillus subtilis TaxID=1423 RepID=UPI0006872120|nr:glycosyltransferase [Bacillus subtilis]UQZ68998.1 methyltransferase domain-containing protein [Bacillus subtilis PY79]MDQ4710623.1 glycosyltransferase [Bacillus subtilis]OOE16638.1 polypeptide N-acetylgalactosaminyltransferase [Bacillus subtilis]PAE59596.1 polypeptide N-acetylgalactosaminyltransferase [Bacillus subtilis]RJS54406.1 polypeptide N-acetylgalactosaminyltransferase [Bacillus subtilis]
MVKTSIIVLTYNQLALTKQCLESIWKHTNNDCIEVIVIDNGSHDGTRDYLKQITSIKAIFNKTNEGFAKACNQGLEVASGDNILFLNNDTVVTNQWLEPMIKLLYQDDKIGMVGPVSNYVSGPQQVPVNYTNVEEIEDFSRLYCLQQRGRSKAVLRLVGFCLLVKKKVLDEVGGFDERFVGGSFEDDDLSLRVLQAGYQLKIALDSFVHHHGHATFTGNPDLSISQLYEENRQRFIDKWKVDVTTFFDSQPQLTALVPAEADSILHIGCGTGAAGTELLNRQSCLLYGIEKDELLQTIASPYYEQVISADVETCDLPYPESFFDVILIGDLLNCSKNPRHTIETLAVYLKPSGSLICSIPNTAYADTFFSLLCGASTYTHFITPRNVNTLFPEYLYDIKSITSHSSDTESNIQLFLKELQFLAGQFGLSLDHLSKHAHIDYMFVHAIKKKQNKTEVAM